MILTLLKRKHIARIVLVIAITCITTLILFFGSMILHVSHFSPFSFAHAATTCATTRGDQPDLCEQQNPVQQGCTQDAHLLEMESVYTHQNKLIGEVDAVLSATCKTFWVQTTAYANTQEVQAIDAIITFHTGKIEDIQKTVSVDGQRITAITDMTFGQPILPFHWKGVFHLKGQTQPLTIPL